MEDLVEVVDAYKHLIGQPRRKHRVQHCRVVVHVDRSNLEVVLQIRACCPQRGAAAKRRRLTALSSKPAEGETVFLVEIVVNLGDAVVTIASGRDRTKEVVDCCGKTCDRAGPGRRPEARCGGWGA